MSVELGRLVRALMTYTRYPARGTTKPFAFARSITFSAPAGKRAGMLKLADSFMSEKIQIVLETASELPLEPDSSNALSCQRPPIMSVSAAVGDSLADLDSKFSASWCRARVRSSVNAFVAVNRLGKDGRPSQKYHYEKNRQCLMIRHAFPSLNMLGSEYSCHAALFGNFDQR